MPYNYVNKKKKVKNKIMPNTFFAYTLKSPPLGGLLDLPEMNVKIV